MLTTTPRVIAALFALPLVAATLASCATARTGADSHEPLPPQGWQPAISAAYARMAAAMTEPGSLYHLTITSLDQSGANTYTTTVDALVDAPRQRARGTITALFGGIEKKTEFIIEGRRYYQTLEYDPTFAREATTCRNSDDPLLSLLLACRGPDERGVTAALADADYHGRTAIAFVTQGTLEGTGDRAVFTETLFVDPETNLPLALEGSGRAELFATDGSIADFDSSGRLVSYAHEFVPIDTVPPEHFEPASIGYTETDPVAALADPSPDFTPYWPGRRFEPEGTPALEIKEAFVAKGAERPALRYRVLLTYAPAGHEFGPTLLAIQQWRRDEWEEVEEKVMLAWRDDPCVRKQALSLDNGGTAIIYSSAEGSAPVAGGCPGGEPSVVSAVVKIGSTILHIDAPDGSPYNDARAVRRVIDALYPAY